MRSDSISDSILSKTIIDFKPISPQYGDLFQGRDPAQVARRLEQLGVLGLSVVTAREHFGGSLELLRTITSAVKLPILRKDFVHCEDDLRITRDCGATGILLICSTIADGSKVAALHDKALTLGLVPVVEVHRAQEMQLARDIGAKVIGINNKDITILEKDSGTVGTTLSLIKSAPAGAFVISESGISCPADAQQALDAGANAVLVGTAFWRGGFIVDS